MSAALTPKQKRETATAIREAGALTPASEHGVYREVLRVLDLLAQGVPKEQIRETMLAEVPTPFLRKVIDMAAAGFPATVIAERVGMPDKHHRAKEVIEKYKGLIAGIQCAYSEVHLQADVAELRRQNTKAMIESADAFREILHAENLETRRRAHVDLWNRSGYVERTEIDVTISNIVQYSMTGDVRAIFEAIKSGEAKLVREGPPEDIIDAEIVPE